jgi:hypothetical protein
MMVGPPNAERARPVLRLRGVPEFPGHDRRDRLLDGNRLRLPHLPALPAHFAVTELRVNQPTRCRSDFGAWPRVLALSTRRRLAAYLMSGPVRLAYSASRRLPSARCRGGRSTRRSRPRSRPRADQARAQLSRFLLSTVPGRPGSHQADGVPAGSRRAVGLRPTGRVQRESAVLGSRLSSTSSCSRKPWPS